MALIENIKKGRTDGAYTRIFGNKELGALISRVHATTISAGTQLEKIIIESAGPKAIKDLSSFLEKPEEGIFLVDKKTVKKSALRSDKEPDFLILRVDNNNNQNNYCYIIELKDGDNFDTKKAAGEVTLLKNFQNHISKQIQFLTSIHICCFNQDDKSNIISGFKGTITEEQAITGKEFCNLLGIDYEEILKKRKADHSKNIEFFIDDLLNIKPIKSIIKNKLI